MANRLGWVLLTAGAGASLVGLVLLVQDRKQRQRQLLGGTGRDVSRLGPETPIISETASGGMVLQHRRSRTMPIEERVRNIQEMIWRSVKDPSMVKLAREVTYAAKERDGEDEARAIYNAVKARIRYTGDVAPVMMPDGKVEAIDLYQSAARTWEFKGGDCLPQGTLLLNERLEFVPIEKLVIGSKIWGKDAWTEVKDVWAKGVLPIDVVFLNNGSQGLRRTLYAAHSARQLVAVRVPDQ